MATYSFQEVHASLVGPGGSINLGYGAGVAEEGISIEMNEDKNMMTLGADGEGMNSLRARKDGTVTVRLLKTSPVNSQLMALYDAQSVDQALWGENVITVTMPKIGDLHAARQCAFKKPPNFTYAQDGDVIEWEFDAVKIDRVLGTY